MTASVPWPRASAENVRIIQTQIGSATGRNANGGTRPFVSARAQTPDRSSAQRKTRVPRPTQTPAAAPSNAHLRVLMSRAVCSVYQRLSSERRGDSSREAKPRSRANRSRRRGDIRCDKRIPRVREQAHDNVRDLSISRSVVQVPWVGSKTTTYWSVLKSSLDLEGHVAMVPRRPRTWWLRPATDSA